MDIKQVGMYISSLRKGKGMTQRALAKHLSITHQAVSKWEKGLTLPDIEILMEMSKLFNVTIDDLITKKIDENIIEDEKVEELPQEENTSDSIKSNLDMSLDKMIDLAPFVSQKILDKKFLEIIQDENNIKKDYVEDFAPFISREALEIAIKKIVDGTLDPEFVEGLAPFIGRKALLSLINRMEDKDWVKDHLDELAPFLPREYLDEIFDKTF